MSSPPLARRFPGAVLLITLWAALAPLPVLAQSQGPGTVTLRDGSQLHGTILLYVPGQKVVLEREGKTEVYETAQLGAVNFTPLAAAPASDATAPSGQYPSAATLHVDLFRAHELARLYDQLEAQRLTNQRWQVPAVGLAVGVASILTGALMLALSVTQVGGCACYGPDCSGNCDEGVNVAMERAGLVLTPVGAALVLIDTPLLIVRAVRAGRMRRTEATIRRLGGQVSFAPLLTPRGDAGLGARLLF